MPASIGFYGIISDPAAGWVPTAEHMVRCGVTWIQLRMKGGTAGERLRIASELRRCVPRGHRLIINDDARLAEAVGADGVHLGQGDMDIDEARAILGPGALVGLSTHSLPQLEAACERGPDYVGMGPVFPTGTKLDAEPCIGLDGLARMVAHSTVPSVAIGGIGLERVRAVMGTGVGGLCAVGPVCRSRQPAAIIDAFSLAIERELRNRG
jgi:thiamine-phosphate pyrophosphorylase